MGRSADIPRVSGETGGDDRGCHILHVDMDAFFASVEVQRRPELRGRPVLVGGSTRGVVAAASYEARRYGVRSAMPMSQALRLCPNAVVLPPDRAAYSAASAQVMGVLRSITPLVEPLSLDEAFLDVQGAVGLLGRPAELAAQIRARIVEITGLTCSVGIAPTKFVAKVASARCKPNGMLVVPVAGVLAFLHPLPVTALWGVGARTAEPLRGLGVRTIGELAVMPIEVLRRAVGVAAADHLAALAQGRDPRAVSPDDVEKSMSAESTYDSDLTELTQINRELLRLADEVSRRLRERSMVARTVGIKIRYADFRTVTRVRTLPDWVDSGSVLHHTALELYQSLDLDRPRVRLVGVKAEGLQDASSAHQQLRFDQLTFDAVPTGPTGPAVPAGSVGSVGRSGLSGPRSPGVGPAHDPAPSRRSGSARPGSTPVVPARRRPLPAALDHAADAVKARFGQHMVRRATLLPGADRGAAESKSGPAEGSSAGPRGNS